MRTLLLAVSLMAACTHPTVPTELPTQSSATPPATDPPPAAAEDPYLWLEDVDGERSLAWVKQQNQRSMTELEAVPAFTATLGRIRSIFDSRDRIPWVSKQGKWLYNLWKDDKNPRGLWRRTTLAEYRKAAPRWEPVLDLDALARAENENWVLAGLDCLYPAYERCLISLSRGGADAAVVREFDVIKKEFVAGGFSLPEAKSAVQWKDIDTVYVGTDFGPDSFTNSGYPRIVKEWRRGTPLTAATLVFAGKPTDVSVSAWREHDHGRVRDLVSASTFDTNQTYLLTGAGLTKLEKPDDVTVAFWDDQVLLSLRTDWTVDGKTWPAGSLLASSEQDFLAGKHVFTPLFTPSANTSLAGTSSLKRGLLVTELKDVHNVLSLWRPKRDPKAGTVTWTRTEIPTPPLSSFNAWAWDDDENDDYWLSDDNFLTPTTLTLVRGGKPETLKRSPAFFAAEGLAVSQHFVASKDGTKIPYFQVARKDLAATGDTPTLIEGYGGFEVSLTPGYSASVGVAWLERGGVYVVPNLRGGGEYGPTWHQAAIKDKRQTTYDDFAAIAQDLIDRKVTRPGKLGIVGGSNGGLLVGVMMTQRPELFGAVVCQAPLLDMRRFSTLLAGASWMEEYGDPSLPEQWAYISKYSPYHNVRAGVKYPRVLFTTSTRDDRVHPGHARKMMARMLEQGHDALFYENIEGGHAGAADNSQRAYLETIAYAFLWQQLSMAPPAGGAATPTAKP